MSSPLVLLDVDGVLNVLDDTDWDVVCNGRAVADGVAYPITWAPNVVAAFRRWIEDGVEVQWLTTWGHDANASLRHLLELPELTVAGTHDGDPAGAPDDVGASHAAVAPAAPDPLTGRWWKYDVMQRLLVEHPDRTLIWIDDELYYPSRFRAWADQHPRVHAIGPNGSSGLTAYHLEQIEHLLNRPS